MAHVGQKVECILASWPSPKGETVPVLGAFYRIRDIRRYSNGRFGYLLFEITNTTSANS